MQRTMDNGWTPVTIPCGPEALQALLSAPAAWRGLVLFAHGSGSGRLSPRNQQVARALNDAGFATLLLDLLTAGEERVDRVTAQHRFDIDLLTARFEDATRWARRSPGFESLPIGYFGASTGSAVALRAAAALPDAVSAVVSRGGRPDLAGAAALARVRAPTLLVVGEADPEVLRLNRLAATQLPCEHRVEVVPRATHLFEEPGTLEQVVVLARSWFGAHPARAA
jgi:putative phosphoribosyl transferase